MLILKLSRLSDYLGLYTTYFMALSFISFITWGKTISNNLSSSGIEKPVNSSQATSTVMYENLNTSFTILLTEDIKNKCAKTCAILESGSKDQIC